MKWVLTSVLLILGVGAFAQDVPLKEHKGIRSSLQQIGAALMISEECEEISIRKLKGFFFLHTLKNEARALGYSRKDIDDYVGSREEKKKLEQEVMELLAKKGAKKGKAASFCQVGKREMQQGTQIGAFLS